MIKTQTALIEQPEAANRSRWLLDPDAIFKCLLIILLRSHPLGPNDSVPGPRVVEPAYSN